MSRWKTRSSNWLNWLSCSEQDKPISAPFLDDQRGVLMRRFLRWHIYRLTYGAPERSRWELLYFSFFSSFCVLMQVSRSLPKTLPFSPLAVMFAFTCNKFCIPTQCWLQLFSIIRTLNIWRYDTDTLIDDELLLNEERGSSISETELKRILRISGLS